MLTNAAVKAVRPRGAAYKIFDGRSLHLQVASNGRKSLRMKFRFEGREKLLTIGTWPEVSLVDARARCELAHEQLGRGVDPSSKSAAAAAVQICTLEDLGGRWHAHMLQRWTPAHATDALASLERDVFSAIGTIATPVVLTALCMIEARGRLETARRVLQRISGVFMFAIDDDLVQQNPSGILGRVE